MIEFVAWTEPPRLLHPRLRPWEEVPRFFPGPRHSRFGRLNPAAAPSSGRARLHGGTCQLRALSVVAYDVPQHYAKALGIVSKKIHLI